MRILALSHYYPPEVNAPVSRLSEHARVWREAGHEVTVVTCVPNHPAGQLYPGYRNRLWQEETIDGIRVIRLWTFLAANEGFLPRIANYLSYLFSVIFWMWRLPRADIVMSTSPQFFCGLAGWFLKRRKRPWVLEIRDLWPESIVTVGAMKRGAAIRAIEKVEAFAYRKADLVVSVTDGFVPHICARRPHGPIVVIKNGADLSRFASDPAAADAFRAEHSLTGKFVASYVGTHGMAHGLQAVIAAAERTILVILAGVGATAFLARLGAVDRGDGVGHQVFQLQRLDEVGVPDHRAVGDLDIRQFLPDRGHAAAAAFKRFLGAEHGRIVLHGALHLVAQDGCRRTAIGVSHINAAVEHIGHRKADPCTAQERPFFGQFPLLPQVGEQPEVQRGKIRETKRAARAAVNGCAALPCSAETCAKAIMGQPCLRLDLMPRLAAG